jgi:hypothetical protein
MIALRNTESKREVEVVSSVLREILVPETAGEACRKAGI